MANVLNDKYELIEVINTSIGDFESAAFKARERFTTPPDTSTGRVVLLRKLPVDASAPALVEAATRAAAIGRHPNILAFHGITELTASGGFPAGTYVSTEYVRGISLRERIRRVAPFSLSVTLDIAIAVGHAAQFAAEKGVSHGHLCAEQIILTPEGQVKVADFAVAQAIHDSLHSDHDVPGSDIRAIGMLLFEMLTGAPPLATNDPLAQSPRASLATVPPAIDGITRKALSTNPRSRYASLNALAADLQTAREDLRAGKPLSWTPMGPSGARSSAKQAPGLLTQAATELAEEERHPGRPAPQEDDYEAQGPPAAANVLSKLLMVVFILVVISIIVVIVIATTVLTVPSDTVVPNLVGKQFPEAQDIAKANHFNLVVEGHSYSDVWPVNTITSQTVPEGRQIKSGKDVGVEVSDGPPLSQVPDVSQMVLARAKQMIQVAGLPVGSITKQYSDVVPSGIVISQEPAANSMVSHKTPINITVSRGPSPPPSPTGLSASATVPNDIDLSWNDVSNASSYDVYRDGKRVASGLTQPAYSDTRLGANETHSYTVSALNVNGESAQSAPVSGASMTDSGTPVDQTAPLPVAPDATTPAPAPDQQPDEANPTPAPSGAAPRQRQFHIRFRVPSEGSDHNVQIEVQDATGTNVVYDETRSPGRVVDQQINGFGNKVIIRIYLDGKLIKQETK